MNEEQTPAKPDADKPFSNPQPKNRRRLFRWTFAGVATLAAGAFAFRAAHANGMGCGPGFGRHRMMGEAMDPESVAKFIDWRVSAVLAKVDATPEQKAKVGEIAKAAARDLLPMREQHRAMRAKATELLMQPTVDRAALEQLRVDTLQRADTLSRRATQAIADAAEVLTPAQREKLAQRWKEHRA